MIFRIIFGVHGIQDFPGGRQPAINMSFKCSEQNSQFKAPVIFVPYFVNVTS